MDYTQCYNNFNDLYMVWADQKIELDKLKRRVNRNNIMLALTACALLAVINSNKRNNEQCITKIKATLEGLNRAKGE